MIKVYGVAGYALCEVTKLFLGNKGADFAFIDLSTEEGKRRQLEEALGSPTRGAILEDAGQTETMQGVSVGALKRPYEAYRRREG